MRLSTDPDRDEESARQTIAAAVAAGVTVFDTAHAYGRDGTELGHNERLLARVLRETGMPRGPDAHPSPRIVTKGGMTRPSGAWIPDGRAKAILADCDASLAALDGLAIDLYLIHAPDPRTPWRTSVRALARLLDQQLVSRVGLSNVNRRQLDEAIELAPVAAVEVALTVHDDRALRGGIVERCAELGIAVIAHSPLGGPRRAGALGRRIPALADAANKLGATPAEAALAWLLGLDPNVVPIPGARRPEAARSAARAALRELADALETGLSSGVRRIVLDNTYLTRAARSHVIETAHRYGVAARCVWLDTPLAQAQVNLVERMLAQFGMLPAPGELKQLARRHPGVLAPTSQMRTARELEPPAIDEGFEHVEAIAFVRHPAPDRAPPRASAFVAAAALERPGWEQALEQGDRDAPHLLFHWSPGDKPDVLAPYRARLAAAVAGPVDTALCPHPGGPPTCWCRPPLPGLPLAFARAHGADPAASILIGTGPAHRNLAAALGARYIAV